ncbi:uncharacterized protein EI90DRAFT_3062073 [Cantharellus anzutake]|uniref:uncharacterized protein n=1 Tax=Cantharellus anzutake TaxID=1750568 RepID=UPI001908CB29|nr:uncharacterized protein EI90DRAFT_3062073 [Cantharellus anzutake]KAF8329808.1 hypothetical protein EI90DRAFT_3062073 [Cantharellus anzutake]
MWMSLSGLLSKHFYHALFHILPQGYSYFVGWVAIFCFEFVSFGVVLNFWTGPLDMLGIGTVVACLVGHSPAILDMTY